MIDIIHINPDSTQPMCVFGVVMNEAGVKIENEMVAWLRNHYHVIEVRHDGTHYEQPALRYMQNLCKDTGRPCLYVHTKGAYNKPTRSGRIRRMWRDEFVGKQQLYFDIVEQSNAPCVATPFTGEDRLTRYNGFVANAAAMKAIPDIVPNDDRMVFERIFANNKNIKIVGVCLNNVTGDTLKHTAHLYLSNYYS